MIGQKRQNSMLRKAIVLLFLTFGSKMLVAQTAYFADGYHGGIWGHYPLGFTSYIVGALNKYPDWRVNLEIEPETWDRDAKMDVSGYNAFRSLLNDTTAAARMEYVNPTYAQPYMYNISGESIIRQFSYGMKHLKKHFPLLSFKTYSSEEPCFTSALPQLLKSFGYQYASLKNPNTGWGGYTRAKGKDLLNWVGPDGSSILTSPRYEIEKLRPNSTWETIGNDNNQAFISTAFADGIKTPLGMCLQDAGWQIGPWLKGGAYQPTAYTTWRNYFENIADRSSVEDWKFGQEDVLTSLVWGAQVLQRIAQQTRIAENKIVQAEKIAMINKLEKGGEYPWEAFDTAWRNLMLAQHHDCWIVPYNGSTGDTWADRVRSWTNTTNHIVDSLFREASMMQGKTSKHLKVYNTSGVERNEWIRIELPESFRVGASPGVKDRAGRSVPSQSNPAGTALYFKAKVPAFGYAGFRLVESSKDLKTGGAKVSTNQNGEITMETDLYRITIDKSQGGTIKSIVAKSLANKEFVGKGSVRKFNELRGFFFAKGAYYSNADKPALVKVLENGPFVISLQINSEIGGHPVQQVITLKQGQQLIDFQLKIDWQQNEGIGEFAETPYHARKLQKAFYDDRYKLLTLFPLALKGQKVSKDAPFDVTESKLENTFFKSWDSIKNNVVLNWVDVVDADQKYGLAMFTDHTTSYIHGADFPLGLTTQYSGYGLWGRNYKLDGPTEMKYQLLPHVGNWQRGAVSQQESHIKEPMQVRFVSGKLKESEKWFLRSSNPALTLSAFRMEDESLFIRVFNASATQSSGSLSFNFPVARIQVVDLNGNQLGRPQETRKSGAVTITQNRLRPFEVITFKVTQ